MILAVDLDGYEETLGPKHASTLSTVGNLGNLYLKQGKMEQAEQFYMRALRGYESTLGLHHLKKFEVEQDLARVQRQMQALKTLK